MILRATSVRAATTTPPFIRRRTTVALLALGACVLACSPTLDWRESRLGVPAKAAGVKMPTSDLRALFPCKPETVERTLPLAGDVTPSQMHVCKADGLTWSVVRFQLSDPSHMQQALRELRAAQGRNVGGQEELPTRPVSISGMTPSDLAVRVRFVGGHNAGKPVVVDSVWAARGPEVIQISVVKPLAQGAHQDDAVDQFIASVHW